MKKQGARVALSALVCALGAAGPAVAADKITLMVGGIEKQIYLPAKLTENLGFFKEQGLEVELLSQPAGVDAENELVAGAVQGVVGFYDHTIDLQAKGKLIESVVQLSQAPGEVELVATKMANVIKSPADFKGHTLGVTGLGSSTNFLTQYMATAAGLKPGDFSVLAVGAGNTFIAAIQQGKIDAGMTTEPTISQMLKTGEAKVLIDLRTPATTAAALGGPYPAASLYMEKAWVDAHHAEVQKLANAFVKTLKFIASHSAEEIAAKMPADYLGKDQTLYVSALASGKSQFTTDGVMPANGPETVLKVLSSFDRAVMGKKIDLSKTYTTEFVSAAR